MGADSGREHIDRPGGFWRDAVTLQGALTRHVLWRLLIFGGFAALLCGNGWIGHHSPALELALAPYEMAGAVLALLLVLRTNAGYERWWEGRKLWGGIVNRCRHLAVVALSCGPDDPAWRGRAVRLIAAFAHTARHNLRDERELPEVAALLGEGEAATIAAARHMPSHVALLLADHLRGACDALVMDRLAFLEADRDLAALLDDVGGCERIRKTPLPRAYAVQIRHFIIVFLVTLPFALLKKVGWQTPFFTVLVAYPILALDEIGDALQSPFALRGLSPLPLDAICRAVEDELTALASARIDTSPRRGVPPSAGS